MTDRDPLRESRVRGLLLGLGLGDCIGSARRQVPDVGLLHAGVSTQLACFTTEGLIRASMRAAHRGLCHPPSVVWHAYCRWAAVQGLATQEMRRKWSSKGDLWPDGWLAHVPALAQRRGSAPSTVSALQQPEKGTVEQPTTTSRGCHAVTRSLPIAALAGASDAPSFLPELACHVAALTHGDPAAHAAAAAVVTVAAACLDGSSVQRAVEAAVETIRGVSCAVSQRGRVATALREAVEQPRRAERLAQLAPDATAPSALSGGVYVAASFPDCGDVVEALQFAAAAPDGDSVAAVTGALLGALHGVECWPVELLSRLELAWVLDTLARDLVAQLTWAPGGSEYCAPQDPHWWTRYPGW